MDSTVLILKNSTIIVTVVEVLNDIIVVSYSGDHKVYQGILLDASKKRFPHGITTPAHFFSVHSPDLLSKESNGDVDSSSAATGNSSSKVENEMYSISQRHTYFQNGELFDPKSMPRFALRPKITLPSRFKSAKMTVRLRPRRVLCSRCGSVCNDNSQNVASGGKDDKTKPMRGGRKEGLRSHVSTKSHLGETLVPKIQKLKDHEISQALNGGIKKLKIAGDVWRNAMETNEGGPARSASTALVKKERSIDKVIEKLAIRRASGGESFVTAVSAFPPVDESDEMVLPDPLSLPEEEEILPTTVEEETSRVLRKKRSVGLMEDLWDETIFEDKNNSDGNSTVFPTKYLTPGSSRATTPIIKISFGSQGKGTVMKIPAKVKSCGGTVDLADPKEDPLSLGDVSTKSVKKAMKKAKKDAHKRKLEPCDEPNSSEACDQPVLKKHRHKSKAKHKKRRRVDRKREFYASVGDPLDDGAGEHNDGDNGGGDVNQKLSINLRRLNATSFVSCDSTLDGNEEGSSCSSFSGSYHSTGEHSEQSNSSSNATDEGDDEVPPFGEIGEPIIAENGVDPLLEPTKTQSVSSYIMVDGKSMSVGDVVWGKIQGFPWWPGKVLSINLARKPDGKILSSQAHVSWYGSTTSSFLSCDHLSPFMENFKFRHNRKKRGIYKEAIRQARLDIDESEIEAFFDSPPEVLNVNRSPREVDCMS